MFFCSPTRVIKPLLFLGKTILKILMIFFWALFSNKQFLNLTFNHSNSNHNSLRNSNHNQGKTKVILIINQEEEAEALKEGVIIIIIIIITIINEDLIMKKGKTLMRGGIIVALDVRRNQAMYHHC